MRRGAVILLALLCCGEGGPDSASSDPGVAPRAARRAVRAVTPPVAPLFDGSRAFGDLRDLVEIGPRPAGSPGAARARELIRQRLRQAGWRVEAHVFQVQAPATAELRMTNLIGIRAGERAEGRILLVTHYDTKRLAGMRFVGANDGASGVALLLELARWLGARPLPFTVWLVFFDGEEAFDRSITAEDGLFGSRALVRRMAQEGTLEGIRTLVLVDMVADRDLNLMMSRDSSPALRRILREAAESLGMTQLIDPQHTMPFVDDHTPFLAAGVREVLALIDFQFGARRAPGPYWHTERDDLDAVSQQSLNSVGRLLVEVFTRIEMRLLERAPAR